MSSATDTRAEGPAIVVYGATGNVGGKVARALAERGARVVLAGRDRHRLERAAAEIGGRGERPEIRVAAAHDAAALERAAAGAAVVAGCAGPFGRVGEPVLRAALAAGAHYVDIAGEPAFLRASYEACEAAARRAERVAVCGMGFEVALGDWAAALAHGRLRDQLAGAAAGDEVIDEVAVAYAVDRPRRSPLEDLAEPCPVWRVDRWEPLAPGSERRRFSFGDGVGDREAILFPRGEAITVPRHIAARSVRTFLWLESAHPLWWQATKVAPLVGPLVAPLAWGPLGGWLRSAAASRRPEAGGEFAVLAEASHQFQRGRALIRGRDPTALSAHLCASAALALAARPRSGGGLLAPAQAFDPHTQLHLLESLGLIEVT